jgi:hypothetical protein
LFVEIQQMENAGMERGKKMLTPGRCARSRGFFLALLLTLIGCGRDTPGANPAQGALPGFSAVDVNVNSARYQEAVSPRDYLGQISAWYFGHST